MPAWYESDAVLEADFLGGIRLQFPGLRGRHTVATVHPRPDTQDLFKATFPDNVSCFPHSELCLCQLGASSSKSPHRLVHFSKGILKCAFAFTTLGRTRGIQSYRFLIAVNNHLDKDVNVQRCFVKQDFHERLSVDFIVVSHGDCT
jgi:hypothetical protein